MCLYENLIRESQELEVIVLEKTFRSQAKGLCKNNKIGISTKISTNIEKACVLAEELGHICTTSGNIILQEDVSSIKQEKRARNWAYEKLVPLQKIIEAYHCGIRNRFELSLFLEVTEDFLDCAILHYKEKYGLYYSYNNYLIYFEPLGVLMRLE